MIGRLWPKPADQAIKSTMTATDPKRKFKETDLAVTILRWIPQKVGRQIYVWLGIAVICLAGCDGDPYSGFGAICSEGHPALAHARSLSQEQLAFLYAEMYRLREQDAGTYIEYGSWGEPTPANLKFLNAARIRPNGYQPNIMLAGCMDEYIYLRFDGPDSDDPRIELSWAAPTNEKPYGTGSQVLWRLER